MKLIGLDIGTTSIAGVLIDGEQGDIIESIVRENDSFLNTGKDWEKVQDPAIILATVRDILNQLINTGADIHGLGITGQMHGIVYVDRAGSPVSPLYTWQDQRGNLFCDNARTYTAVLSEITGYPLATGFGMVTHCYNAQNGLATNTAVSLCTIADYVAMALTGRHSCLRIDYTNAAGLGLFDVRHSSFDRQALKAAGIDENILPPTVLSATLIGHMERGIPVCSALGDNQASFLGSVGDIAQSLLINIGTGGQISVYTNDYADIEGLETRPFPGGGFILVGASLCGGKAYAVLEQFFRDVCRQFADHDGSNLYEKMNDLVQDGVVKGEKLIMDTRFLGTRREPQRRGSIQRISIDNFTPQHLILGFLEGIANELFELYDLIPDSIKSGRSKLVGSGNGLRNNQVLRGVVSNRFGLPVLIPVHREEAAFGAALSAGVGLGLYRDFATAGTIIRYQ